MRDIMRVFLGGSMLMLLFGLPGCANHSSEVKSEATGVEQKLGAAGQSVESANQGMALPVRFQNPSYIIADGGAKGTGEADEVIMTVGMDLTSAGPMSLREIMKILAEYKGMTVSWASDVNQNAMVDVDLGINDDFFEGLDNVLRQLDYFHEVEVNTIVVKYNETKRYHLAIPKMALSYSTSVGGNVLGGTTASNQITSSGNTFDVWTDFEANLQRVFSIHTATAVPSSLTGATAPSSSGNYIIDQSIGLVTITAPRTLQAKIADYISSLKKELYRQVAIEAKIVEVNFTDESVVGINWSNLIQDVNAQLTLESGGAAAGQVYPLRGASNPLTGDILSSMIISPGTASGQVAVGSAGVFNLVLNAITKSEGKTKVLSSPKLITMNGKPAMINVGTDITYISRVQTTVDANGAAATTVTPDTVFEGLGMSIVPIITEDNEIVVNITPVISSLREWPISTFTTGTTVLSTPEVNMREMNTMVRIKSGDTLVVGGMIKETDLHREEGKIPLLGDIPFFGNLFKQTTTNKPRTELLIIMQPTIL